MSRPREGAGDVRRGGAGDIEREEPVRTRVTYITRWDKDETVGTGGSDMRPTEPFNYSRSRSDRSEGLDVRIT